MKSSFTRTLFAVILIMGSAAFAEEHVQRDIAYDDAHPSQILDVYPAESAKPAPVIVHIHGGAWRAGSKKHVPAFLLEANGAGWLAIVSVEYRFTDVAPHPAQVDDCARAIQFVRHHAKKWNLDPDRIGVTGGSAGGHLSAYVAAQEDEADPDAEDPIARTSSRVAFAIPFAPPTDWGLLRKLEHKHPAYRQLLGYEPGTPVAQMASERLEDVSPVSFVSAHDPPFLIVHGDADQVVPFAHATQLDAALKKAGVSSELFVVKDGDHSIAGAKHPGATKRAMAFIRQHLLDEESGS